MIYVPEAGLDGLVWTRERRGPRRSISTSLDIHQPGRLQLQIRRLCRDLGIRARPPQGKGQKKKPTRPVRLKKGLLLLVSALVGEPGGWPKTAYAYEKTFSSLGLHRGRAVLMGGEKASPCWCPKHIARPSATCALAPRGHWPVSGSNKVYNFKVYT